VHFPWCVSKCPYCDFFSVESRSSIPHEAYADAVIDELDHRYPLLEPATLQSIYVGGGTPSLWDESQLGKVIDRIVATFGGCKDSLEITVECNPSSFDILKCKHWSEIGVNRLSLGLQSLDDDDLKYLGRAHDARAGMDSLRAALDSGIARVCVDLIFGLPKRTAEDCIRGLLQLPLDELSHISAYALTIEPNTPFGALARKGKLDLAPEQAVMDSFVALHEQLAHGGFEHYEISNYARSEQRSTHNSGYWRGHDYLGLGVAAWGTVSLRANHDAVSHRCRYRNTTQIARYLQLASGCENNRLWERQPNGILAEQETIDSKIALSERLMLGLRTSDGVNLDELALELDMDQWLAKKRKTIDTLIQRGRIVWEGARLAIPFETWYLADGTISQLM
jgi:putative oxygen-independent coproporphyrinogen III oxidase